MIYQFEISSQENKKFSRIIEIDDNQTFLDFHKIIVKSCDYDEHQMASFFVLDKNQKRIREITLFEMSSENEEFDNTAMDVTTINNFSISGTCLQYVFDFFSERYFVIKLLKKLNNNSDKKYPIIKFSKEKAPIQIVVKDI